MATQIVSRKICLAFGGRLDEKPVTLTDQLSWVTAVLDDRRLTEVEKNCVFSVLRSKPIAPSANFSEFAIKVVEVAEQVALTLPAVR